VKGVLEVNIVEDPEKETNSNHRRIVKRKQTGEQSGDVNGSEGKWWWQGLKSRQEGKAFSTGELGAQNRMASGQGSNYFVLPAEL